MSTNSAADWHNFDLNDNEEYKHQTPFRNLELYVLGTVNIESTLLESKEFTIEDEYKAYQNQKTEIEEQHMGKYVAVYSGEVVDSNSNENALIDRFYKKYGNKTVYFKKVGEPERVYNMRSPRLVDDNS